MSTARFGTLCDICGAGSLDYAHDANPCGECGMDLCDSCALETGHELKADWDEDQAKEWQGCANEGGEERQRIDPPEPPEPPSRAAVVGELSARVEHILETCGNARPFDTLCAPLSPDKGRQVMPGVWVKEFERNSGAQLPAHALQVGDIVRVAPGYPAQTVMRATECAAYLSDGAISRHAVVELLGRREGMGFE